MSINDGLHLLNQLMQSDSGRSDSGSAVEYDRAQQAALMDTAEMARKFIVSRMQRKWPQSGAGGEFPAKRSDERGGGGPYGGLDRAIIVQKGVLEAVWTDVKLKNGRRNTDLSYKRTKPHIAMVMVNPEATDTSKGRRLQRYAKYLQTGWTLNTNKKRKYMDVGQKGHVPRKQRNKGVAVPGKVQPPRPFLEQVILMNYQPELVQNYRRVMRSLLPDHMKSLADTARLTITYNPPTY